MAAKKITEYVNSATDIVKEGSELLESIDAFTRKFTKSVDDAIAKIDKIKHSKVTQANKVRFSFQSFRLVVENASSYVDKVDDFNYYSSNNDKITRVKRAVRNGKFQPLKDLVDQLQQSLAKAQEFYDEFIKACNESSKDSSDEAAKCQHLAITARSNKRATRAIGGTAATAALGGGIALSVVAGVFTFGIGAVVGLSLTAAGLGAGGLVTSIATGVIAKDFNETEKEFRELSRIFNSLASGAFSLYDQVLQLHTIVKSISTVLDDVDAKKECQVEPLCESLELLQMKTSVSFSTTTKCLKTMKATEEKVKGKV